MDQRSATSAANAARSIIKPGEQRVVFQDNGAQIGISHPSLAIVATQEESSDDGGSQSGLGVLEIGGERPVRVEFDVNDGVVLSVPATQFAVSVQNMNQPGDPDLYAQAFVRLGVRGDVRARPAGRPPPAESADPLGALRGHTQGVDRHGDLLPLHLTRFPPTPPFGANAPP